MPTYTAPTNTVPVSIEGRSTTNTLHVRGHSTAGIEYTLTPAGLVAVMATLSAYWSGLSAANLAALLASNNGILVKATQPDVAAAVLAADHATVAANLQNNVRTAGATARG